MYDLGEWPASNCIEFTLPLAPVSQQASSSVKGVFAQEIRKYIQIARFLLSGDVQLRVGWRISEQARYEHDRAPDIDNILKPLIDSLVGPDALIIDDTQVQQVTCAWSAVNTEQQSIRIGLLFKRNNWVPKRNLVFVRFQNGLCLPIPDTDSREKKLKHFQVYSNRLSARAIADSQGVQYNNAKILMPEQRVFHRTRLSGFVVLTEQEFLASIA